MLAVHSTWGPLPRSPPSRCRCFDAFAEDALQFVLKSLVGRSCRLMRLSPDVLVFVFLPPPPAKASPQAPLCLETAVKGQSLDSFAGYMTAMKKQTGSSDWAGAGSLACPVLITYGG